MEQSLPLFYRTVPEYRCSSFLEFPGSAAGSLISRGFPESPPSATVAQAHAHSANKQPSLLAWKGAEEASSVGEEEEASRKREKSRCGRRSRPPALPRRSPRNRAQAQAARREGRAMAAKREEHHGDLKQHLEHDANLEQHRNHADRPPQPHSSPQSPWNVRIEISAVGSLPFE